MILFAAVLIIPLLIALGCFLFSTTICWKELLIIVGVQIIIAGISALICYHSNTADTEIWNGYITDKKKEWTSCEHSYSCNCRSCSCDSKGNCSTCCDTCYDHFNDWDWKAYTSNKETIYIRRVDSRGSLTPPRWEKIQIGEPSAIPHSYDNYVKAAPDTLFRHQGLIEKYQNILPKYPKVYDYYRVNRFITVGNLNIDSKLWNDALNKLNAKIGAKKEANVLIVFVKDQPRDFFSALEENWIGGKKNDIVLVVGTGATPRWVEVMAWTTHPIFKIKLRDAILDLPKLEPNSVIDVMEQTIIKHYEREPMADFEYLKSSITPSTTQWVVSLIIGFIFSIGMTIFFHINDTFGVYNSTNYR